MDDLLNNTFLKECIEKCYLNDEQLLDTYMNKGMLSIGIEIICCFYDKESNCITLDEESFKCLMEENTPNIIVHMIKVLSLLKMIKLDSVNHKYVYFKVIDEVLQKEFNEINNMLDKKIDDIISPLSYIKDKVFAREELVRLRKELKGMINKLEKEVNEH